MDPVKWLLICTDHALPNRLPSQPILVWRMLNMVSAEECAPDPHSACLFRVQRGFRLGRLRFICQFLEGSSDVFVELYHLQQNMPCSRLASVHWLYCP